MYGFLALVGACASWAVARHATRILDRTLAEHRTWSRIQLTMHGTTCHARITTKDGAVATWSRAPGGLWLDPRGRPAWPTDAAVLTLIATPGAITRGDDA